MKKGRPYILTALLITACTVAAPPPARESFKVRIRGSAGETMPEELDLYAFRDDDHCLESASSGTGDSISIRLVNGRDYRLYLLGNGHGIPGIAGSEEEFLTKRTSLEENNPGKPVMFSSPLLFNCGEDEPTLELRRYLCKVTVKEISSVWPENMSCAVTALAIVNASGSVPLSGIPDSEDIRFNLAGIDSALPAAIKDKLLWEGSIDIHGETDIGKSLYTMPNASDADTYGLPWAPRRTRLAIRLSFGSESNWYPVNLPPMTCNSDYVIEHILIQGPGSLAPDEAIDRTSISFDVRVRPWESENINVDFNDT